MYFEWLSIRNIADEAAVLPSLGSQYVALSGSLPELSVNSLPRLLGSDPGVSCHGIFAFPFYVYPSQQHLATPINAPHSSNAVENVLSSGPNAYSSSKGSPVMAAPGFSGSSVCSSGTGGESGATNTSGRCSDLCNRKDAEEKVDDICGRVSVGCTPASSASSCSLQDGVVKLPTMHSQLPSPLLTGVSGSMPRVVTTSPVFGMQTCGTESNLNPIDKSGSSNSPASHSDLHLSVNNWTTSSSPSPSSSSLPSNMESLGVHAIHQLQPQPPPLMQAISTSNPTPPHNLSFHNQPHSHHHVATTPSGPPDKHLHALTPPTQSSDLYLVGGPRGVERNILQPVPMVGMNGIKLESNLESLNYSPSLNIHPIMPHDGSGGTPLHSPLHDHQQVVERHLLQPGSEVMETNSSNMDLPLVKKEKEKPYKCDHPGCGRTFSFPAHLRSHIQQIHISFRPCKCEFPSCGKRFYTPQHLNVHRRVHTGERPFVCPYTDCSKAFTTAGNLKNHIRTHTGERPYACKFEGCSKRFAEMSSLKKHELTHTGEKPYKCRVCRKAFSQAGSRNTHERKHTRTDNEEFGMEGSRGVMGGKICGSDNLEKGLK